MSLQRAAPAFLETGRAIRRDNEHCRKGLPHETAENIKEPTGSRIDAEGIAVLKRYQEQCDQKDQSLAPRTLN